MIQPTPVAEPVVAAEPGKTTSEWQLVIGGAAANLVGLLVAFGVHLDAAQQSSLLATQASVTALVVSYVVGRSVRKIGTGG